jgi:hypothetical protein
LFYICPSTLLALHIVHESCSETSYQMSIFLGNVRSEFHIHHFFYFLTVKKLIRTFKKFLIGMPCSFLVRRRTAQKMRRTAQLVFRRIIFLRERQKIQREMANQNTIQRFEEGTLRPCASLGQGGSNTLLDPGSLPAAALETQILPTMVEGALLSTAQVASHLCGIPFKPPIQSMKFSSTLSKS